MNTSPNSTIEAKSSELNQQAVSYIMGGLNAGNSISVKSIGGGLVRISVRGKGLDLSRLIHRVDFGLRRTVATSWMPLGLGVPEESKRSHHLHRIAVKQKSKRISSEKEIKKAVYEMALLFADLLSAPVVETGREQYFQFTVGDDIILTDIYKTPVKYLAGGEGEYIYL
jgi:hypothetical protein